jgi:AbrB family looped-hinge helix DNA binding protein
LKKGKKGKTVLPMTAKISSKGQVVLPVALRRKLALKTGDDLDIGLESSEGNLRIVIQRKVARRPRMRIIRDPVTGWPVLKGPPGTPKLTSARVKQMLADFP